MALEIPLALNLQKRFVAELREGEITVAQATAANAEGDVRDGQGQLLQKIVDTQAKASNARVVIVDRDGTVLADSEGPETLGTNYNTAARGEIREALAGRTGTRQAFSKTLDQEIFAVAVPILNPRTKEVEGAVRVTQGLGQISGSVRRSMLGLAAIGVAGLVAGLLLALILAGGLSRPLRKLADSALALGGGDLSVRTGGIKGSREIEEVARSFDDMAERLEATVRAQREFAANASHQLRTPLTGIKLRLESAHAETSSAEVRRQLEAADKEVDRLSEIVQRLLTLSKQIEAGGPGAVDVDDAMRRAATRWGEKARAAGKELRVRGDGGQAAAGAFELDQILDNLIDNAISYAESPITIESGRLDGRLLVAVEDHGPGIHPDEMDRVTERFYRGREAPSGGSGLGLAIVKELAERWGGTVSVGPGLEGGTRVEVLLHPAPDGPSSPGPRMPITSGG